MAINWYPGHMNKANREMTEALPQVDLVIELLDCRLPYSSQNPSIAKLTKDKPCIKILSKSDLADPIQTDLWQQYFEAKDSVTTLLTTLNQSDKAKTLLQLCRQLADKSNRPGSNVIAMITGIPNVGKSTLINAVAGRRIAKTGDEPAITKGLQKIRINDDLIFLDTPGILWPKILNEHSGYRLAISGGIRDTATDVEDLALYLSGYMLKHYPQLLLNRYELNTLPATDIEFLELMGARRGALGGGGHINFEKASTILINDYRAGILGKITLETPDMVIEEERIVAEKLQLKAEKEAQRKNKKHKSSK